VQNKAPSPCPDGNGKLAEIDGYLCTDIKSDFRSSLKAVNTKVIQGSNLEV